MSKVITEVDKQSDIEQKTKTLLLLKWFIRIGYFIYSLLLAGWVFYMNQYIEVNPWPILLLQLSPLIIGGYALISFRPPLLHMLLALLLLYICISTPHLFSSNFTQIYALAEFFCNLAVISALMLYLLKSSQLQRVRFATDS